MVNRCIKILCLFILILLGKGLFTFGFLSHDILGTVFGLGIGSFLVIFLLRNFRKYTRGGD